MTISSFTVIAFTGGGDDDDEDGGIIVGGGKGDGGGGDGDGGGVDDDSGGNVKVAWRSCDGDDSDGWICCVLLVLQVPLMLCCCHTTCTMHYYLFYTNPSVVPLKPLKFVRIFTDMEDERNLLNSFNLVQIINYTKLCSMACTRLRYAKFAQHLKILLIEH